MFKGRKPIRRSAKRSEPRRLVDLALHGRLRLFIVGLMVAAATAVRGNQIAAVGMGIALVATLLDDRIGDWALIVVGVAIGTAIGVPAARSVKMTAMPQMVALFNGVGGGAVALITLVEYARGTTSAGVADPDGSPRSSARSPSGARTSPSPSCRS